MKDNKQVAIRLTRREAINIGLGTLLGSTVAATGTRATDDIQAADATEQERLAIAFWIWALWDTGPNRIVNDFEVRVAEAVERGFNCLRIEGGAGITHDAEGRSSVILMLSVWHNRQAVSRCLDSTRERGSVTLGFAQNCVDVWRTSSEQRRGFGE